MSEHLAAEQARAREAHDQLTEATAAAIAELERIREETRTRIAIAEEDRDSAVARAEADKAEGIAAAERAERELDAGRAERARVRQESGTAGATATPQRRRSAPE